MPGEPRFLSIDDIFRLHALAIEDQGGDPSLRDRGLLESAIATPRQQFGGEYLHPDIPSQAAAYCFHICKNHPFVDGNKRAATAAMIAFLSDNGWSFDADVDTAEPVILRVASSEMNKEALTEWLRTHCHEKPRMELRDFFRIVTNERLLNAIRASTATGKHTPEFDATMTEAADAIPLIQSLREDIQRASTNDERRRYSSAVVLLMHLYRIAEDIGYEW